MRKHIDELWNRRADKVRAGLMAINQDTAGVRLKNFSGMEIFKVRSLATSIMNQLHFMRTAPTAKIE